MAGSTEVTLTIDGTRATILFSTAGGINVMSSMSRRVSKIGILSSTSSSTVAILLNYITVIGFVVTVVPNIVINIIVEAS